MFKKLMNKKVLKNEKGLTLIELLAVIVILAIVAAIAIPAIGSIIENSRYKAAKSDAIMALDSANIYFTDTPSAVDVTVKDLVDDGYIENQGELSDTAKITKVDGEDTLSGTATAGKYEIKFNATTLTNISDDNQKPKSDANAAHTDTAGTISIKK